MIIIKLPIMKDQKFANYYLIMSTITFNPNDIVYIKGIGYATLLNCGFETTIQQMLPLPSVKKQSIDFDPDLFNSDRDSNGPKISQINADEQRPEIKANTEIKDQVNQPVHQQNIKMNENIDNQNINNIVKARLQGTDAFIFTLYRNLSKTIIISINSMLINHRKMINIEVDISKTVEALKKNIFEQLGEQIANYYKIKLFATSPNLCELSMQSKTIYQYFIKNNDKLILTANFSFGFRPIPQNLSCKYKLTLNNNILCSTVKPPPEPKLPIIALPPPPIPTQLNENEPKVEQPRQVKIQLKDSDILPQPPVIIPIIEEIIPIEQPTYLSLCNIQLASGRRYWQIKVEKVPTDESELVVGVCVLSNNIALRQSIEGCSHIWAYYPTSARKGYERYDQNGKSLQEWQQQYGYTIKQNDIIGVLVIIRGNRASISFYKSSISCGQAFEIDIATLGDKLVPFINIGGECQVVLDSKALFPIDSFRK